MYKGVTPTHKGPGSTKIEGIGTIRFWGKELITDNLQLIMNMTNSERRSTSVCCETNGQDQPTSDHVTVASVSLSALLKG